jgi:hypothetical protein
MATLNQSLVKVSASHLTFLGNFGLAKLVIYFAPIVVAAIAGGALYGNIELAMAVGLLITLLVIGAPLSGITQLYFVRHQHGISDLLLFLTFVPALAGALIATAILLLDGPLPFALIVAAIPLAILQNTAAAWCRIRARRNLTAWADGTSIMLCSLACLVVSLGPVINLMLFTAWSLTAMAWLLAAVSIYHLIRRQLPNLRERLLEAATIGFPIMIISTLGIWLGVGGRILIGIVNVADVAVYAVAFRIAGLVLGVHQLATTAFFARLYGARTREADKLFSLFFIGVGILAALISLAGPWIVEFADFDAISASNEMNLIVLIPLAGAQTFFWIGHAMLQMRINRSGLAKATIVPTALLTLGGIVFIIAAAFAISNDVRFVSLLIALHAACYFALNWFMLARRGLPHRRMAITGTIGGILLVVLAGLCFTYSNIG